MNHNDLPFSSEFSPTQINLICLLNFTKLSGGEWKLFKKKVEEITLQAYSLKRISC